MRTMATPMQRMMEIEMEIQRIEKLIPPQIQRRAAWVQEIPSSCNFISKSKREACEKDRIYKQGKIKSIDELVASYRATIKRLNNEKQLIQEAQEAHNEATINLSEDGKNFEAMVIAAHGDAQADIIVAESTGQAIVAESKAESESITKQALTVERVVVGSAIVLGIIAVVVTVVIVRSRMQN